MTDTNDDTGALVVPEATLRWTVGAVEVTRVTELVTLAPREMLLPDVTDDQLAVNADWLGPYFSDGLIQLSFHTFVVVSDATTIIVDTCLGDDPVRVMPGDPSFPDRLGAEIDGGIEAVDLVLCTHLHFDHVGWNTRVIDGRRVPTFPNARYLFGRRELEHLDTDDSHDVASDDVAPLVEAGLVDAIDTDHRLTDEVRAIPTPGHTPGHVSVLIESKGARACITGDAVHSPIQFRYPEIAATTFDWDSAMSTATRQTMIDDWTDTEMLVLGTHFAAPTAGHLRRRGDHVRFVS